MAAARVILAGVAALSSVAVLAACGSDARTDRADLASPGHPLTSPSGRYKLAVVTGDEHGADGTGPYQRVQIRDRAGRIELDSRNRFSTRFRTQVLWDDERDRAWVHSSDVGTSWWDRVAGGHWRRGGLDPRRIARGVPRVPRALVDLYPELFGPQGRAAAKRNVTDAVDVSPKCGSAHDDVRLECPKPP